ncbi:phosphatase PAP2 family protein [Floccifex sp.]|uniref:phosphatase PAP2 family protein n=1 Tax=Floccifex sp. TaxID=2815810 RepID=UPI003EFFE4B7
MAKFISIGMSIFLLICTFFPNGLSNFRITIEEPKNMIETLTHYMQLSDTSTNVFPSIHVYNSLGVAIAIQKYNGFKHKRMVHIGSTILCICICLSTLFLKQHSLFDVFASLILALAIYYFVYQ